VVVNDLGSTTEGAGADASVASAVVTEIRDQGGTAVADGSDVATEAGAEALVSAALAAYGRIDVLVNNAGIMRWAALPEADLDDLTSHLAVHVEGSFNTARAVWPHFVDQGYGRIVMTTSAGVFGLADNLSYATAKGGVIGMARSLAAAGAAHGIKVNLVAPAAMTRLAGPDAVEAASGPMVPDLVAPMVAFLAHEECPVTGEIYAAGGGRFSRIFLATTEGHVQMDGATIEDVAAHWAAINDEAGYTVPADLRAWSRTFTKHLR
jgi:NAD(P)-dependent dehydrogenase (short-subunit alcohol dehydrogenase family)